MLGEGSGMRVDRGCSLLQGSSDPKNLEKYFASLSSLQNYLLILEQLRVEYLGCGELPRRSGRRVLLCVRSLFLTRHLPAVELVRPSSPKT